MRLSKPACPGAPLSDKIDQIAVWQELKESQQASPIHIFCRHQGHQKV
jgi:hypothetical protein